MVRASGAAVVSSLARIAPSRSADREPAAAGVAPNDPLDLVDTPEAGPSVIRGSLVRLVGLILGTVATVASSAVIIRHLGVVDTGRFITVMALVVIVGSISDLGLSAVGVREYSVRQPGERRRLLRNMLGMRLALVAVGLAVAVAFAVAARYTGAMVLGTVVAGVGMVLFVAQQSLTIPLHARLRFGWVASLQLAFQVGVAALGVVLALVGAGLLPFYALWVPVLIPVLVMTALVGGSETSVLPAVDAAEWRALLREILPYSAAVVLSVLYFRLVQILVSLLSSETQTGFFGVSFRIIETMTTIPPLLVSSALPVLARAAVNDPERFDYAGRRLVETMLAAGAGLAVVLFLGASFAVDLVAGPSFEPSVDVLRILAFALIGTFIIAARGYALLSLGRLRAMLVSNAVAFAVIVAAGIPLISAHGATGGAIALLTAEIVLAIGYELSLTRGRAQLRAPATYVIRIVAAAAIAVLPVSLLGLPSLAAATIGAGIYIVALTVLRAVPVELRDALWPSRRSTPEGAAR
jgi:O-antigen/teichoic acid export membrane protein